MSINVIKCNLGYRAQMLYSPSGETGMSDIEE